MADQGTTANNAWLQTTYLHDGFIQDLETQIRFLQFCSPPDKTALFVGDTVRWSEMEEWTVDKTALSETSLTDNEIAGSGLDTGYDAQIEAYGAFMTWSKLSLDTAHRGTYDKLSKRAGDASAKALDQLARDQCLTTTNIQYAGQAAVGTSGTAAALKYTDFSKVQAYFETQGTDHGFDHLNGRYGAVIHPNAADDLRSEAKTSSGNPTWYDANIHVQGQQEELRNGYIGVASNFSVFTSNQITDLANTFYYNVCLSKDGLGCSSLSGGLDAGAGSPQEALGARVLVKKPGPSTISVPLDTVVRIGWKWVGAFKILNPKRVVLLYSAY
jgi:N4-gp56 family major capsid protein